MRGGFVLGLVVAFLISMAFVIPLQLFDVKAGESKSSDLAAWIQAIGSIAAVAGAAYLPFWHDVSRRKLANKQAVKNLENDIRFVIAQVKINIEIHKKNYNSLLHVIHFANRDFVIRYIDIEAEVGKAASSVRFNIDRLNASIELMNGFTKEERTFSQHFIDVSEGVVDKLKMAIGLLEAHDSHHTAPPSA